MRRLLDYAALSAAYDAYHRSPGNRRLHRAGIPLIAFAVVRFSQWGSPMPLASLLLPLYFAWDRRVGALMTAFVAASAALGLVTSLPAALGAFLLGWVFQLAGHQFFERNRPALLDNAVHALVGPARIAADLAGLR